MEKREYTISGSDYKALAGPRKTGMLAPRQAQVLCGMAAGMTYRDIAVEIGEQFGTAKNTAKSVLAKLNANERAKAVDAAMARGWLTKALALALCISTIQLSDDAARVRIRNRARRRDEAELIAGEL